MDDFDRLMVAENEQEKREILNRLQNKNMIYKEPNPPISGWMGANELEWLFNRAKNMDSIVEIGSWMGRSTHALLSGCTGTVYAVDHFRGSQSEINGAHREAKNKDIYKIFLQNVGHFPNLIIFKMHSKEAAKQFNDKQIDMIFIDGDHEQAKEDIETWMPKCRKFLCGHDRRQASLPRAFKELNLNPKEEIGSIWSIEI